jgi:hypothetical protein
MTGIVEKLRWFLYVYPIQLCVYTRKKPGKRPGVKMAGKAGAPSWSVDTRVKAAVLYQGLPRSTIEEIKIEDSVENKPHSISRSIVK